MRQRKRVEEHRRAFRSNRIDPVKEVLCVVDVAQLAGVRHPADGRRPFVRKVAQGVARSHKEACVEHVARNDRPCAPLPGQAVHDHHVVEVCGEVRVHVAHKREERLERRGVVVGEGAPVLHSLLVELCCVVTPPAQIVDPVVPLVIVAEHRGYVVNMVSVRPLHSVPRKGHRCDKRESVWKEERGKKKDC